MPGTNIFGRVTIAMVAATALVGCGEDGPDQGVARDGDPMCDAAWPEHLPSGPVPADHAVAPVPADHAVAPVAVEKLGEFDLPTDAEVRPGDGDAVYVLLNAGKFLRIDRGAMGRMPVGDLSDLVRATQPRGALGFTFSPDGDLVYVHFVDDRDVSVIAEYVVADDGTIDAASERRLLEVQQEPGGWHFGGDLAFGPDGLLYLSFGDGGSGEFPDPYGHGQDTASLQGGLLRIDPRPGLGRPYRVPSDNPFASGGRGRRELWAWGLRNPWKFTFDTATGDLWIADVGRDQYEEVNLIRRADSEAPGRCADFGWSRYEGFDRISPDADRDVGDDGVGHDAFPVVVIPHSEGCSISGGAVYRGDAIDGLDGAFVYGDYCTFNVDAVLPGSPTTVRLGNAGDHIVAIRTGPGGELYVLGLRSISRIVPA